MMTLNYGVCTKESALRKGYGYIVPQLLDKEKGSTANAAPWDDCFLNQYIAEPQDRHYENFVGQPPGDSLAFLRCRRFISPRIAVTINCPVVSPSSFTDSIASTTSCGARACTFCDLLFTWSLCTAKLLCFKWNPVYRNDGAIKRLMWNPFDVYTGFHFGVAAPKNSKALVDCSPARASNHTVIRSNIMACLHDSPTRPKYVYLFLGTPDEFPNSTPTVLRAEADTESDARAKFPRWTLNFAAQIRTAAPCRLQIFSTDDGFMWVYEQRQAAPEVSHA